jgi:hypothetical protein
VNENRQADTDIEGMSIGTQRKRRMSDEYQDGNKRVRAASASSGASYSTVIFCGINVVFFDSFSDLNC